VKRIFNGLLVFASALCLLLPSTTLAAEPQAGGQGIQVSPVIIDLNAEKGKTYNLKVTVTNVTAGSLLLKANVVDFKAKDETGAPALISDGQESSFSFRSWVGPMGSLLLQSKESRQVVVRVNVPANAEAGGHYGVVRFSGVPPSLAGQNISLTASVGILVLARVDGEINEQLVVKQMSVEQNGHKKALYETGPLNIVTRLENKGNVHVKPDGDITVKNFFGKTVASLNLSDQPANVLPDSIRRFESKLSKKWLFGRYTVSLNGTYGTSGKTLLAHTSFWVIPYKVIFLCLVLLGITLWLLARSIKRYNRRVIRRHQQTRR
jgi:hypothetical protein